MSWAERHLKALEVTFEDFWNQQPRALRSKAYVKTGEQAMTYYPPTLDIDIDWVFRIGDVVHNLRVSLDYLTFHIVTKHAAPKKIQQVSFPICYESAKAYAEMAGRRIAAKTLPQPIQDDFESIQPYHGGKAKYMHPLTLLDRLENVHKHRRLLAAHPAVTSVVQEGVSPKISVTSFFNPNGAVLDKPTELYRYRVLDPTHVETDVKFRVREYICFNESPDVVPTEGVIVVRLLKNIRDHIRDEVFPKLENWV